MSVSTRGQDGQQRFRGMATELRFQTADKFEKEDKKQMRRLVSPVAYQFAAGDVTMPRTGIHAQADAAIMVRRHAGGAAKKSGTETEKNRLLEARWAQMQKLRAGGGATAAATCGSGGPPSRTAL